MEYLLRDVLDIRRGDPEARESFDNECEIVANKGGKLCMVHINALLSLDQQPRGIRG